MEKTFVIVLLLGMAALAPAGTVPPDSTIFPGLTGQQLLDSLYTYYHSTSNLGYDGARDTLYGLIDKDGNDSLQCIYSGYTIYMQPGQDPSTWAYDHGINCEHTWPQSSFNQAGVPRGDMNHIYGAEFTPANVNGDRGDLPFRAIPDGSVSYWYRGTVKTSTAPDDSVKDQYSRLQSSVAFQPRRVQEGNTARAIFYFYNMYRPGYAAIETWWQGQLPYLNDLYLWHVEDPADVAEIARTRKIATYQQGKKNPYILDSTLVRRAYFPSTPTNTVVTFNPVAATRSEAAGACSLSVSIANPSADSATTVDVVCAGGTGDTADIGGYTTQTVTFTANSSTPQVVPISIRDDTLAEGTETVVFKLRNAAGGSGAAVGGDSAFTLTITDNDDVTPPVITAGPSVSGITSGSATVAWTTDEPADSRVYYGLTTVYSDTVRSDSAVTVHAVGLSGLAAATTYHYKVSSTDPMNNGPTCSGDSTFATTAASSFTVVINEVNDQSGSTPGYQNEYVELYNNTGGAIGLNGWQLKQYNSAMTTAFGASDQIAAGGYFVIVRTSTGNWSNYYAIPYNVIGSLTLNGGEAFSLHNGGGTLIDSTITFGSTYYCQYRTRSLNAGTLASSWVSDAANGTSAAYGTPGTTNPSGVAGSLTPGTAGGGIIAYPNPFSATARISFSLAQTALVQLEVFNVMGQSVTRTRPQRMAAGAHELTWNGRSMPQGVYFYRLSVDNNVVATRRMTMIK